MRGWRRGALFWLGIFCFVSAKGAALQWTIHPIVPAGTNGPVLLHDLAFGNGKFTGVGKNGRIFSARASEPSVWTLQTKLDVPLGRIEFANGRFMVIGNQYSVGDGTQKGFLFTSTDGTEWTRKEFTSANDVAYGNGWLVVVGDNLVARSTNGVDWEVKTNFVSGSPHLFRTVNFVNGEFIATFLGGRVEFSPYLPTTIAISSDGADWEEIPVGGESYSEVVYGRGKYVSTGATDYTGGGWPYHSDTGRGFNEGSFPVQFDGYAADYANGTFAVVGWNGRETESVFMSSTNGVSWEAFSATPGKAFYGVTFDGTRFVAVGSRYDDTNGVVAVSEVVGPVRRISNLAVNAAGIGFDFNADVNTEWVVEVSQDLGSWSVVDEVVGTGAGVQRVSVAADGGAVRFVRLREKR